MAIGKPARARDREAQRKARNAQRTENPTKGTAKADADRTAAFLKATRSRQSTDSNN
jgi:hypothetical protein